MSRMTFLSAALFAALALPLMAVAAQPTPVEAPKEKPVKPVEVTQATFKAEVEQSKLPVLIDFYSPNCGPCRTTAPHVDKAAQLYKGKVKVVKINVDTEPGLARKYGITLIPTLIIVNKGKILATEIGGKSLAEIEKMLEDALPGLQKP